MNELISQFILESRDLVEQATAGLAALEQEPHDEQWIDATFRAIHTLKGGAAIVDFNAMERLVHAAEDALGDARAGKRPLDKAVIAACLACLDQVLRWLDAMEQSGEVPARNDAPIDALIARLNPRSVAHKSERAASWVHTLLMRNPEARSRAQSAVRFVPHAASFFQGEDPLQVFASLRELLAFELAPVADWPALDSLDPFESMLMFAALSASSATEVRAHFAAHPGECEIVALQPSERDSARKTLPPHALSALQAQIELLDSATGASLLGCIASAGTVAANVLRHCGEATVAETLAEATAHSLNTRDPQHLRTHIARSMAAEKPELATGVASELADADPSHRREQWVRTLRIDAERIDALVRLTGELTVVKNAIGHAIRLDDERVSLAESLQGHHAVLDRLVGELQRAVLGVRVLPLRNVLQRFPRFVREMSESLGKQVNLVIEGEETEADKTVVEMLFEPLMHVIRNAMDHGIEGPRMRLERNKPAVATIVLRASRQSGHVHVEVTDDGRGIDVARVRSLAAERGIVEVERLDAMSDAEAIELVFAPGFSTAAEVTGISGRGVGMDAVRSAVERVGGRVSIESRDGLGTSVRLTLPFSVMMTQVLTAEVGGQMFGIPLDSVVETLSVPTNAIEDVGAAQAFVRRNRTIPIYDLATLLSVSSSAVDQSEAVIIVAAVAGHLGGLRVDRLGERMEVMLKPMEGLLASVPGITGTSILGDGRVLLVLDLAEVLQ